MRSENVIAVLSRGNQELFHSAMLAWLMDEEGSHRLGRTFLEGVLRRIGLEPARSFRVATEHRGKHGRYDILLSDYGTDNEAVIFENKTKSLGAHSQASRYAEDGVDVVLLALLPEMFDEASRSQFPLLSYREVHELLSAIELEVRDGPQFVISQYREYLDALLKPFELVHDAATGAQPLDAGALQAMRSALAHVAYRENDWRTLVYFYFSSFRTYAVRHAPDTIFGLGDYAQADADGTNMMWYAEKNLPGTPFLEAKLNDPMSLATHWTLREDVAPYVSGFQGVQTLIPRLELWGLPRVAGDDADLDTQIGAWSIGVYGGVPEPMWRFLHAHEPYRSRINGNRRRNFYTVPVHFKDLTFERMADRLRDLLSFLYDPA